MEKIKRTDTQNIITLEDAVKELNRLYIQMTFDEEFFEGTIAIGNDKFQEEIQEQIVDMQKYVDEKFKENNIDKLKYLIDNIKEMLLKIPNESKGNSKIKDILRNKYKKTFAEVIILLDELELVNIDDLGYGNILDDLEFSKEEKEKLYENLKSLKYERRIQEENKILDEFEKERNGVLEGITFLSSISNEKNEYGVFSKEKDEIHTIVESEYGKLIALSNYKAYQNKSDKPSKDSLTQLPIKTITKYELYLKPDEDEFSIIFFGDPNLQEKINQNPTQYLKILFLAILTARRNRHGRMEHIGEIEEIGEDTYRAIYDKNLEESIKQLISNETKKHTFRNIEKGRDV